MARRLRASSGWPSAVVTSAGNAAVAVKWPFRSAQCAPTDLSDSVNPRVELGNRARLPCEIGSAEQRKETP